MSYSPLSALVVMMMNGAGFYSQNLTWRIYDPKEYTPSQFRPDYLISKYWNYSEDPLFELPKSGVSFKANTDEPEAASLNIDF